MGLECYNSTTRLSIEEPLNREYFAPLGGKASREFRLTHFPGSNAALYGKIKTITTIDGIDRILYWLLRISVPKPERNQ
jgi:hypothetical protein